MSAFKLFSSGEVNHLQKLLEHHFSKKLSKKGRSYLLEEIVYGYTRFLPTIGREFILRVKLADRNNADHVKFYTVHLLRRLAPAIAMAEVPGSDRPISIILPLLTVDDRFREFLQNIKEEGLKKQASLTLIVVVFSDDNANQVEEIVKESTRGFPKAFVTIAISEGIYKFTKAVETGMSLLSGSNIAFVADVNMRIKRDFWQRCQENTRLGQQAYFPIPFWVYEYDYRQSLVNETGSYPIDPWTGQWAFYSFRSFCITKRDYDSVGGYLGSSYSSDLIKRLLRSNVQVFQAPDTGIYQFWRVGSCSKLNSRARKRICLTLQETAREFPQSELVEYLTEQARNKAARFWFRNIGD